jgi:hypothetical protein
MEVRGVALANGVTLDFATVPADRVTPQHCALLVPEAGFTAAYARIRRRGIEHRAGPRRQRPGTVNHNNGGRASTSWTRRGTPWSRRPVRRLGHT